MKKTIILSILLLLAILLTSCGKPNEPTETSETTQQIEETTLPPVKTLSEYVAKSTMDDEYDFIIPEVNIKKEVTQKTIRISGKDYTAYCNTVKEYFDRNYTIDIYHFNDENDRMRFISYRTDTNKVIAYDQQEAKNQNYVSAVNPASTESEYIAYAKKIIFDNTGVSLDGWRVKTESYSDTYGRENKFVNYEEASLLNTYTFTFYKTIDGIERCDKTVITMTNMGEIIFFDAMPNDEAFAPYLDVEVDADKVKEAVWSAFKKTVSGKRITSAQLVTNDDGLWVEVSIAYNIDGDYGGLSYVVQVAEIEKIPISAEKTQ